MATWVQKTIGSTVVDSLTAAKITTGTLSAATTITVGEATGGHTEIGQGAVRILRPDSDGVITPTITMGGATRDVVQIIDPDTGSTLSGLNDDGSVVGQEIVGDVFRVGGNRIGDPYDPNDVLWGFPRGMVSGYRSTAESGLAAQSALGTYETSAVVQGGRVYRARMMCTLNHPATGGTADYMYLFRTVDGTAPTIGSPILYQATIGWPTGAAASQQASIEAFFYLGTNPDVWVTIRVLHAIARATSGTVKLLYAATYPAYLTIEDIGPMGDGFMLQGQPSAGNGTPSGAGAPVPPPTTEKRSYTKTYTATWGRTWRESGAIRTDVGSDLVQGEPVGTPWGRNYAAIGFPSSLATDLSGATISKLEVYLYAYHWWNSSGTMVIGVHGATTVPASFSYSGQLLVSGWKRGTGRWVTLPSTWYPAFASGTNRGITLGGGASTSAAYYGKIRGYGTTAAPQFRATYTK